MHKFIKVRSQNFRWKNLSTGKLLDISRKTKETPVKVWYKPKKETLVSD